MRNCAVVVAAVVVAASLPVGAALADPREEPVPGPNPDLVAACGLDIHTVLDESGSVQNYANDVRRAFRAFTSSLKNTGSRLAVSEFSTVARLPLTGAPQRNYTVVTDATIANTFEPYISNGYQPNGYTNWEDGFRMGRYFLPRPSEQPHLTVFITDGDPTAVIKDTVSDNDYRTKVPLSDNQAQSQVDNNRAKDYAVPNANAVKSQGSHVLVIAVGAGLNSQSSLNRLIDISGPDVYSGSGTFDISTHDIYRVADFSNLEEAMREAAFQLCAPSITVRKLVDLTPDPGTDDLVPAPDWDMTATANPVPARWVLPAAAVGATATQTTDANGFATFQWTTASPTNSQVSITEQNPAGVPPGFVNDPAATSCVARTPDSSGDITLPITLTPNGFSTTVTHESIATCRLVNRVPPAPSIEIEKATNGTDADAPPGPAVPIGDPVNWTYAVTNTGNDTLSSLVVTDNQGVAVTCPGTTLGPGDSMVCTARGVAAAGPYANIGSVTGVDPFGTRVNDSDPSHYFGAAPGIDIEKATNGADADFPPGPFIPVGGAVNWTYVVTNTGNLALTGIVVADDRGVVVTCPAAALAIGATMTCTGSGVAAGGPYENTATATGVPAGGGLVQDSDASHYYGEIATVDIEKTVNGVDADVPTGPLVNVGDAVGWGYEATNTGNVPLRWTVTDNLLGAVLCPRRLFIFPGETIACRAGGVATAGQYTNIGTVQGTSPSGQVVNDNDPANYFGVQGGVRLKKFTNGIDADVPPGPFIAVGAPVAWTYVVTNTGNGTLTNVAVRDLRGVAVTCPAATLAVGASMTCTGAGTAQEGQYTNRGVVTARTVPGKLVFDFDPSNYFGAVPGILIKKSTNGDDADQAPGPAIRVGAPVEWTYTVYNTGNAALNSIAVTDDRGVTVACPAASLAAGASMVCTAAGTATAGQYDNTASVVGTDPLGAVLRDSDPSHYYGVVSGIDVQKYTNGQDADTPTGPSLALGGAVTWTYVVTNTGNIPILQVALIDDRGVVPSFVSGDANADARLDVGETWTYTASGTAQAGQYQNTATVSALDALEDPVSDSDPSHYFASSPFPSPRPLPAPAALPAVSITKTVARSRVRAGTTVRFTLRVRNTSTVTAQRVRVCDTLPSGLAFASARGAKIKARQACFTVRTLPARKTRTFTVVTRAGATSRSRRLCNSAVRTAQGLRARRVRACIRVLPALARGQGGVTG